jgi:hypothetical protein
MFCQQADEVDDMVKGCCAGPHAVAVINLIRRSIDIARENSIR